MSHSITRREMLAATAAAGVGLWTAGHVQAAEFKTKIHKAMFDNPTEPALKELKKAGFDGIETSQWDVTPEQAAKGCEIAEKLGMKIHSVLFGWANFNQKDHVEKDIANVQKALHAAKGYGASALLLVPCRIGGMPMPEAWEFELEFDRKTRELKRVVAGDNSKYQAYIEAQNQATAASRKAVQKLIPTAEKTGVIIALENVWNNLWVKPAFFASFIRSFRNPLVQCYFDIGNHVKYAPAEEWIRALGKTIVKLHVKDFKLNADGHGGNFVHPRDGSVDWPLVRQELEKIGYNDWMTIEDGGLALGEFSRRLDLIVAGK
jgi:hexulose-6-phosphate isomerase